MFNVSSGFITDPQKDLPINPPDKSICSQEPDSASQKEIHNTGQEAVAEKQQARDKPGDVQLEKIVPDAVGKNPKCAAASCQEALPPPVIILVGLLAWIRMMQIAAGLTSKQSWL